MVLLSVQVVCSALTLEENQNFRAQYYEKSLTLGKRYGVTHDFGNNVRGLVSRIDIKSLQEKHKSKLDIIKNAMDNCRFSWALAGLPVSGKSILTELMSQLLEKPLVCTDDFVESSFLDFEKYLLPQTIADIKSYLERNPNITVCTALRDKGYYKDLRMQKVNEAILFAHANNFVLDACGQETSINEASKNLLKALGVKVVYMYLGWEKALAFRRRLQ